MTAPAHPSELAWARHLAGEPGWLARRRLRRHLRRCEACRRLEASLAAERRAFDADPARRQELARLAAERGPAPGGRPARHRARRWPWLAGALAAASATALVLLAVRTPAPDALRAKGGGVLELYVERPGGAAALGERCAPGDRLIARYRTDRAYLLLLESDGRGAVQVVVPAGGAASMRLTVAEGTTPTSWVLDGAPGPECFAAFFSDAPVDVADAARALRAAPSAPELPGAAAQVRCCRKEAAR